jgi:hypothetical protein
MFKNKLFEITIDDEYIKSKKETISLIDYIVKSNANLYVALNDMIKIEIKEVTTSKNSSLIKVKYRHTCFKELTFNLDNHLYISQVEKCLTTDVIYTDIRVWHMYFYYNYQGIKLMIN